MLDELTLRKAVEFAVKTEELGAMFYEKMAKKFSEDEEIGAIFATLAKDEQVHQKQFRKLLEEVPEDHGVSNQDARWQYLRAMSLSEFFMRGLYKDLDEIKTRDDALERAFSLEKDTLGYYVAMKEILGKNEILGAIIAAEKGHMVKVMEYLVTGAKMRGLGDTWTGEPPK